MIRVVYRGPPHPLAGLVSMLEDADYEVTYDPPDLQQPGPAEVELTLADIQLQGVGGVEAVVRGFEGSHRDLPVTIRVQPPQH